LADSFQILTMHSAILILRKFLDCMEQMYLPWPWILNRDCVYY